MKVSLQDGERILFEKKPEKAILVLWFFKALFYAGFIALFTARFISVFALLGDFTTSRNSDSFITDYFLNFLILFIIIAIISIIYQIFLLKSYTFYITNERVILFGGILLRKIKNVPYHKITDVSITQNIIERMININSMNIHTAGTGAQRPEIRFFSLHDPEKPQAFIVKELKAFKESSSHSSAIND